MRDFTQTDILWAIGFFVGIGILGIIANYCIAASIGELNYRPKRKK